MRLQEIYFICKKSLISWSELRFEEIKTPNQSYYKLLNSDEARAILFNLEKIKSLEENILKIRNISIGFTQSSGVITFDAQTKGRLSSEYSILKNKVITLAELFESVDYTQESEGFDVKLPKGMSLSELSKCAHDLDIVFSTCPLFGQQEITFKAVDVGSVWLNFIIGGAAISHMLDRLAGLVDKALILRSHYLDCKKQEEAVRQLKLSNDVLQNVIETNKTIGAAWLEQATGELARQHEITEPEEIARLNNSIKILSDWMKKGMEIYASIQASPEVKAVFPPIERQSLPDAVIDMLTDGSSTEE